MKMNNQLKKTGSNSAPIGACMFVRPVETLADAGGGDNNGGFRIVAYSGEVITGHWYWGNIAFDLAGQKFAKDKTPILAEHNRESRIGFSTKQEINDKIIVEGSFLSNPEARQLKSDMSEGFPMQASVYNVPEVIEHVEAGDSVEVNGHKLDGPGTVFRRATIHEVSMCTLGADGNTESQAIAAGDKDKKIEFETVSNKETEMDKSNDTKKFTAEMLAAEYPDVKKEIETAAFAAGGKDVLDRFNVFLAKFGDSPAFVIEQFAKGSTLMVATEAYAEKMKGERDAALAAKGANRSDDADKAARQEFSDMQAEKPKASASLEGDEKYEAEYKADPKIRDEFLSKADYLAFRRAEDKDLISIAKK